MLLFCLIKGLAGFKDSAGLYLWLEFERVDTVSRALIHEQAEGMLLGACLNGSQWQL